MSVLSIAQNIAKETGFAVPTSLVGNTDALAIQLLFIIKRETRALSDRFIWQQLITPGTFNFVNAQETYDLPSDFKDYVPKTMWNYTSRRPIIAPIDSESYEVQKNYLITSGIDKMAFIYGNKIHITPIPGSTDTINYLYTTTKIYQSSVGVGQTDIVADTDTTAIREYIVELGVKLRFLVAKGLLTSQELGASLEYNDYENQVQKAIKTDGFGQSSPITMRTGGSAYWKGAYTQDSNFPSV